jgi:hypothetical protein
MALSPQVIGAVLTEISLVGKEATEAQIQEAYLATVMASAKTAVDLAITLTVKDWDQLDAFLAEGISSTSIYPLRDQITDKVAARDATDLGVLLMSFYASAKAHLG